MINLEREVERLSAELESLYAEGHCCCVVDSSGKTLSWCLSHSNLRDRAEAAEAEVERLRGAIKRALDDEESGEGWGPDVTVCEYLRAALEPQPQGDDQ